MKTVYFLVALFFCCTLSANTLPDSIYNYRVNADSEVNLVSKTTYSIASDSKDYSVFTYRKGTDQSLQLKHQKEYLYTDCEEDLVNFVLSHKIENGEKILAQQVSYDYDDQCRRTSTLVEKVSNGELEKITQILSNDFDDQGNARFSEMLGKGVQRTLEAKNQTYKKYSYNEEGQIVQMEVLHYSSKEALTSSISRKYAYDLEGRLINIEVFNNLANSLTEIQKYTYKEGIKVMESFKPKKDLMYLSLLDSTFFDNQNRIIGKRKYRQIKGEDGLELRSFSTYFYSEKNEFTPSAATNFANVKVKDFANQSGIISISGLNDDENYDLNVYDVLGRMIASKKISGSLAFELRIQNVTGVLLATLVNKNKEVQTTKFTLK